MSEGWPQSTSRLRRAGIPLFAASAIFLSATAVGCGTSKEAPSSNSVTTQPFSGSASCEQRADPASYRVVVSLSATGLSNGRATFEAISDPTVSFQDGSVAPVRSAVGNTREATFEVATTKGPPVSIAFSGTFGIPDPASMQSGSFAQLKGVSTSTALGTKIAITRVTSTGSKYRGIDFHVDPPGMAGALFSGLFGLGLKTNGSTFRTTKTSGTPLGQGAYQLLALMSLRRETATSPQTAVFIGGLLYSAAKISVVIPRCSS